MVQLAVFLLLQEDVDTACGAEDSDFQPILKPYQLVGVNFLLLLYKKRIGGGTSFQDLVTMYAPCLCYLIQ